VKTTATIEPVVVERVVTLTMDEESASVLLAVTAHTAGGGPSFLCMERLYHALRGTGVSPANVRITGEAGLIRLKDVTA
jgi:hypothetical protein